MEKQHDTKIERLKAWLKQNGCLLHPSVQIPSYINGFQGVSTKQFIPYKTIIMAVPVSLILTVSKCYNCSQLNKLFTNNDQLFDFEQSEDAEFNVLCVFLMYHKNKINNGKECQSFWAPYLQTICEPQTAIDWPNQDLGGLNRSLLEEILHIRKQCKQLQDQIVQYLMKYSKNPNQPFYDISEQKLRILFNYCYRAVMTRCFGFYFGEACLIPAVDLMNHGCQAINHQLMYLPWQLQKSKGIYIFNKNQSQKKTIKNNKYQEWMNEDEDESSQDEEYYKKKYIFRYEQFDCSVFPQLNLPQPSKKLKLPFRMAFLEDRKIFEDTLAPNIHICRQKITHLIQQHNVRLLSKKKKKQVQSTQPNFDQASQQLNQEQEQQNLQQQLSQQQSEYEIEDLNFCQQKDEQDNDTDQQIEKARQRQFDELKAQEQQMVDQFRNKYLVVKKYKQVKQEVVQKFTQKDGVFQFKQQEIQETKMTETLSSQRIQDQRIQQDSCKQQNKKQTNYISVQKHQAPILQKQQPKQAKESLPKVQSIDQNQLNKQQKRQTFQQKIQAEIRKQQREQEISDKRKHVFRVQEQDSGSSDSDAQPWSQKQGSYFTVSTDAPIEANQQVYNSYGSRTNKFLLIWYGFTYRNNLYDSVSLRLHVKFPASHQPPPAESLLLDTYLGGHGLISFKKHGTEQIVESHEMSKQFRLKRSKLCLQLIIFLRLYLLNYYNGQDLAKIMVTIPSSIEFETFLFAYYLQMVQGLYSWFSKETIEELRSQQNQLRQQGNILKQTNNLLAEKLFLKAQRNAFKIIYLEQQRKIIDLHVKAGQLVMGVLKELELRKKTKKEGEQLYLSKQIYEEQPIEILKICRQYLIELKMNIEYIDYDGNQMKKMRQ